MTGTAGQQQPGRDRQRLDVLGLLQQHAPADRRRPQAETEEADSDVSPMIMAGSASVVAAMMWLRNERHHVARR